ncbi:hypothetical protein QBC39DRAFT_296846 [Podospora conica]|nr:hypothetical protein QBC39DRAFT_296846 [Schizothecium conicum]
MPLHLLGKKSWNVYNADNIARVRRDEAEARAREEADEQRMQEADAARRLAILRGEIPPPLEPPTDDALPSLPRHRDGGSARKRKRAGEDDTEFEMRVAREQQTTAVASVPALSASTAVSLTDSNGHISLFPPPETAALTKVERNPEVEREKARKERDLMDQYQMRFVNAGGSKEALGAGKMGPWYAAGGSTAAGDGDAMPSKNVWGKEDPGRKVREVARLGASDPLAMMKRAAAKVRELGKERNKEAEEREREIKAMRREEKRRRREADDRRREMSPGRTRESGDRRRERSPGRRRENGGRRQEESLDTRKGESRGRERSEHRREDGRRDQGDRRDEKRRDEDYRRHDRRHGEDDGRHHRPHQSKTKDRHRESHRSDDGSTQKHKRPRSEQHEG